MKAIRAQQEDARLHTELKKENNYLSFDCCAPRKNLRRERVALRRLKSLKFVCLKILAIYLLCKPISGGRELQGELNKCKSSYKWGTENWAKGGLELNLLFKEWLKSIMLDEVNRELSCMNFLVCLSSIYFVPKEGKKLTKHLGTLILVRSQQGFHIFHCLCFLSLT